MVYLRQKDLFNSEGYHIAETILRDNSTTFLHTHDFYEIFIVTEGEMSHLVNGKDESMTVNSLRIAGPGDAHQFKRRGSQETHFTNVAFSNEICVKTLNLYSQYSGCHLDIPVHPIKLTYDLGTMILTKFSYLSKVSYGMFRLPPIEFLTGFLLDCFCFLNSGKPNSNTPPLWLSNACEAMRHEENYTRGLTRFIDIAGKSQEHLTRCMKQYFDITPSGYINGIRLEKAATLLQVTNNTVLDVLLDCGFNNVSHFNQLFKKKYGITPMRYRYLNKVIVNPTQNSEMQQPDSVDD